CESAIGILRLKNNLGAITNRHATAHDREHNGFTSHDSHLTEKPVAFAKLNIASGAHAFKVVTRRLLANNRLKPVLFKRCFFLLWLVTHSFIAALVRRPL